MQSIVRIVFPHQNFVSRKQAGNSRSVRLIAALVEAGCDVDVITSDVSYLGIPFEGARIAEDEGLRIFRVHLAKDLSKSRSYLTFNAKAWNLVRSLPRPDAVLATTPPLPGLALSLALAAGWKIPLVLEVRDLWPAFLIEGGLIADRSLARALEFIELLSYSLASGIAVVSPGFLPYFRELGIKEPDVSITGLDPAFARSKDCCPVEHFQVAYTGSLNEAYGVHRLAEIARGGSEQGWRTVVAGSGRGLNLIQGVPGIDFLGPLPREALPKVLHASQAGLNIHADWPLLATTLTGKLFDYLAAGLPVVETSGGCMGALVDALHAGLCCKQDTYAVLDSLATLAGDVRARESMAKAGATALKGPLSADFQARTLARKVMAYVDNGNAVTYKGILRASREAGSGVARGHSARALRQAYANDPRKISAGEMGKWLAGLSPIAPQSSLAIASIL